ncbi:MAG: transcriptional regulator [Acidobacteriota bacterium]|nr:transcriptional regulator [Acidobacteriota bacterium]
MKSSRLVRAASEMGGFMLNAVQFDSAKYRKLVAEAMPVVIETEAENERLLAIVEPMMRRELSLEEAKLFDLLVKLIEDFEEQHYPMGL